MDGWITIGTKLDNKELQKQLREEENNLKRFEREAQKLLKQKAKIEVDLNEINTAKTLLQEMTDEDLKNAQTQEQIDAILKDEAFQMNILNEGYKVTQQELNGINDKLKRNNDAQEETKQNIEKISQKIKRINEASNFKGTIENIGTSISKVIKKITLWGLAILGVRSAYMLVRQAMSTLSQYDDQLATDIQYIRFALAMTLERFIKPIVEWIFKLLQYVNYLTMAWFNLNLFEKATVSAFNKSNKSAEKLKKTLAGFDEMNVLNDNDSNSSNVGGIPSQDLSNMQKFKAPKWLEWIKDHGNEIKNIIIGIAAALALIKFAKLLAWGAELTGILGGLLQIGIIAIGVELLYTALTGRELISDIKEIKKGLEDLNKIRKEQNKQAKSSQDRTKSLIKTYNEAAESVGVTKEKTELYIDTLLNGIKADEQLIENMEKQKNWLGALNGDNQKLTNTQKEYNKTIDIQLEELKKLYDKGELNNKQKAEYQILLDKQTTKLATENRYLQYNSEEWNKNREKIAKNKEELERITGKKYEVKTSIQTPNTNQFENSIKNLLRKVSNWFSNFGELKIGFGWGSGGGGFRGAKGAMYYPKLAAGGIINMPGRGVPYHGAIIGERGAEAVVPLTDSQQMELLGQTIAKNITINATIVNSMNGRVLSRELQKVQNQANFATNGRWS